jgi:hypothetical protein
MRTRPNGTIRPMPVRSVSMPAIGIATIAPRPCGARRKPEVIADSPRTTWKYSGSSRNAPKTEIVMSVSVPAAVANVRFVKSRRSMSGSPARSAWRTNAPSSSRPAASGTRTSGWPKPPAPPDSARP